MPELPEVEAARGLVELGCKGKRVLRAVVADDEKVINGCTPDELRKALEGRTLLRAHRKGKYMWLELDNGPSGPWVMLHFGMTGGIVVKGVGVTKYKRAHLESNPDTWPPRFTKLELELAGGGQLAYVDSRRFGRIKLLHGPDPLACEPLCRLGWDVLLQLPPTAAEFAQVVRSRVARAPALRIKALLLDQEFCSGIGNWVADEVLYQSRIHPEQTAASMDDSALAALHAAIREVVGLAVRMEADSDRFPKEWLFHYRWTNKKASKDASGRAISFVTVGSRTSAFVPALQKLKGSGAARAKKAAGGKEGVDAEEEAEQEEQEEQQSGATAKRKRTTKKAVKQPQKEDDDGDDQELRADSDKDDGGGDVDGDEEEEEKEAKPAAKRRKTGAGTAAAAAAKTAKGKSAAAAKPAPAAKPARGKAATGAASKDSGKATAPAKTTRGAGRQAVKPEALQGSDEEATEGVKGKKSKAAAKPKPAGSQRATRAGPEPATAKVKAPAEKAGGRAAGGRKAAAAAAPVQRRGRAKK
ncbi:hypothetical protein HYH02_010391 [Chlamydomonas schloesseri]|uniref:Formamidopyrimidine-DNA glycosylase catalytic domain-containing protein n=1 Tax=Chlamydomonas schloesseri TaxID=2026947 RepID=A0A835T886_9CHLO|nr:hypothetical protein HYH02_010391 [Chlamydomonas schloesseri]|eukprot:KAG2440513.1 hypothetical protein HYH02_010391 [Chlamydomonas schloesseri]